MIEPEVAGAGAVLLAAYLGIDRKTLSKMFAPALRRHATLDSAVLWGIVKLLQEERKSVTEVATIIGIDVTTVDIIKSCVDSVADR